MTAIQTTNAPGDWPELPLFARWEDTCTTLLLWTQIVGKIRMALSPNINHFWGVALYVTTRGLTTSPIPNGTGAFAIDFDFVGHVLRITCSDGSERSFALEPMSVAAFYRKTMGALQELGIEVTIFARPVEVVEAIPFAKDETHASYDADAVFRFWTALVAVDTVFTEFRARFMGKCSPVHFFWGAFDLAVTRFSGRTAPKHPGGAPNCPNWVMEEAYSHEVSSAGFWAGDGLGEAAFYAYAYPGPAGFREHPVLPETACFHEKLGEFILPYEAVRTAPDPAQALLAFLQTTYEGAAILANWDRTALER
ncbi:MAG: hypothetical protein JWQ02_2214 [Capsulimonas sp.]|jgi:hypothetical protein|nr:hypothetical protein [Capsulimonas sp.]